MRETARRAVSVAIAVNEVARLQILDVETPRLCSTLGPIFRKSDKKVSAFPPVRVHRGEIRRSPRKNQRAICRTPTLQSTLSFLIFFQSLANGRSEIGNSTESLRARAESLCESKAELSLLPSKIETSV